MANKTCVVRVEGILRESSSRVPLDDGTRLYHCLAAYYKLILRTNSNSDEIERWLGVHGFKEHFNVYTPEIDGMDEYLLGLSQLYKIREDGEHVDLALDPNPEVVAKYLREGVTCLLYSSPKYSAPIYRPDYDGKVRPWTAIETEMEAQFETRNRWKDAYSKESE